MAVVSKGARFESKNFLKDEGTTVLLFIQDTSAMETQFLTDLEPDLKNGKNLSVGLVRLKDTNAPAALQYEIKETPTAIVYDRFGNTIARTSKPDELKAAIRKGELMGRIKWI